jgi:hypothetical protein
MTSPLDNLNRMLAELSPARGPRIPFATLCGAFYALQRGFPHVLIAQAIGLTPASISKLANCLRPPGDGATWRYRRIAEEWARLGEQDFADRYYDAKLDERIARIRMGVALPADNRTSFGPNPQADKYAAYRHGPVAIERIDGIVVPIQIVWREPTLAPGGPPPGWAFQEPDSGRWSASHRTSALAYDAAFENYGHDSPRPKPGRPRHRQ